MLSNIHIVKYQFLTLKLKWGTSLLFYTSTLYSICTWKYLFWSNDFQIFLIFIFSLALQPFLLVRYSFNELKSKIGQKGKGLPKSIILVPANFLFSIWPISFWLNVKVSHPKNRTTTDLHLIFFLQKKNSSNLRRNSYKISLRSDKHRDWL